MSSKYLLVAALSAVALAACNNEDVMEANRGRGISFQVATEASTRIGATTTNTIDNFKVWGFTGSNETLMNGVAVSKTGGEWSYGDPIFWPESTVDFYAVSPTENCGGTVSISSSAQTLDGKVETAVDLTTVAESAYTGSLFLMPQELKPWNIDEDKTNENGGSYFVINCKIYNKAGDDEVLLWPSEDKYAYVAIPTSDITWEQGKKYVYTFTFGNGGGYVPPVDPEDPDKEPEDGGDPVLVPVDFTVTVDDFEDGTPQDIDMNNDGK